LSDHHIRRRRLLQKTLGTETRIGQMMITGGCFCGRVRYEVDSALGAGRSCHCSRCRKAFSGAGSAYAEVKPGSFSWVLGEDNLSRYEATPGWGLCFCRSCGTTLCGTASGKVHGVALGSVDGDPGVQIEMHIFVGSKAPWDHIGGHAPQYQEFPPHVPPGQHAAHQRAAGDVRNTRA